MAIKDTVTFNILQDAEHGVGAIGTSSFGAPRTYRRKENGIIVTTIKFDITGLGDHGATNNDVIGLAAGGVAYIGRYVKATYGVVFKMHMSCIEAPVLATGTVTQDLNIVSNSSAVLIYSGAGGTTYGINGATMVEGQGVDNLAPALTAGNYFYITAADTAGSTGVYGSGQYILTIYGHELLTNLTI